MSELLTELSVGGSEFPFVLSVISFMELEHGWHRAADIAIARRRRMYLDEVEAILAIEPVVVAVARIAARVDAKSREQGRVVAAADLLIGATALRLGYPLATHNERHFRMIPGLTVIAL